MLENETRNTAHEAVVFAAKCHHGQTRKGSNLPYMVHPMEVLILLSDWGVNNIITWSAAVCHDVREECPDVSYDDVAKVIGVHAADVVEELTFMPDLTSGVKPWVQKEEYMKTFGTKSVHALVIKVADRCCNTNDFRKSEPRYAPKYWAKAAVLLSTFAARRLEVSDFFGPEVYEQAAARVARISERLAA